MRRGFADAGLAPEDRSVLQQRARDARGDVLRITTLAGSGHLGGSLSSLDIFLLLFAGARVDPQDPEASDRDRIVISHAHTAAGVYAALGRSGFFSAGEALSSFRRCGSVFEGHATAGVPGVEWTGGNLGQGLSVGCGMALACRYTGSKYHVYVVMGDGEQQKGQVAEARRFAAHYRLNNLTAIVDWNGLQATGETGKIMAQDLVKEFQAPDWQVLIVDGHDFDDLYRALRQAGKSEVPTVILARTVMGKGVSFIENVGRYHGQVLPREGCFQALVGLGLEPRLEKEGTPPEKGGCSVTTPRRSGTKPAETVVDPGVPRTYPVGEMVENRTAFGEALADLARVNLPRGVPLVAVDCDLYTSVKTDRLAQVAPERLIQCGIQEHHAAGLAGGLSVSGAVTFLAGFGVFAIEETFNQQRLNDINSASIKLVCTHCGLDVGEDGKTHQCVDYVGLFANLFGWRLVVPADANQTDRAVRYMATTPGNIALAVGRSKLPVLTDRNGLPRFGGDYELVYGRADRVRVGSAGTIVTCGTMTHRALKAAEHLGEMGWLVGVLNVSCPLALDEEALTEAAQTEFIVVYEDHNVRTGLGNLVGTFLMERGLRCRFRRLGITRYGGSGKPEDLYRGQGLDIDSLVQEIRSLIQGAQ